MTSSRHRLPRSPAATRPARERPADAGWIRPFLRPGCALLELGCGGGKLAEALLEAGASLRYLGLEPNPALAASAAALLEGKATVSGWNPAGPIPLASASQDLVLCLDLPGQLRMDELYMSLAETRRLLRPGGVFLLRTVGARQGLLGAMASRISRSLRADRLLLAEHFLSPEDWKFVEQREESAGPGRMRQLSVLARLPG